MKKLKAKKMKININEIVVKMKILDEKKTKAIITLDFGVLVTKSFRILESPYENMNNEKLWLIPPFLPRLWTISFNLFRARQKSLAGTRKKGLGGI